MMDTAKSNIIEIPSPFKYTESGSLIRTVSGAKTIWS